MQEIAADRHLVLWDGDCALCGRAVDWCAARDVRGRLQFVAYQDAPRPPMDDALAAACARAVHVLALDSRRLRAGRATLFILRELGWHRVGAWGCVPPLVWLVELLYALVARNRVFFGRILFRRDRLAGAMFRGYSRPADSSPSSPLRAGLDDPIGAGPSADHRFPKPASSSYDPVDSPSGRRAAEPDAPSRTILGRNRRSTEVK